MVEIIVLVETKSLNYEIWAYAKIMFSVERYLHKRMQLSDNICDEIRSKIA